MEVCKSTSIAFFLSFALGKGIAFYIFCIFTRNGKETANAVPLWDCAKIRIGWVKTQNRPLMLMVTSKSRTISLISETSVNLAYAFFKISDFKLPFGENYA